MHRVVLPLVVGILSSRAAAPQGEPGPEFRINTYTNGDQRIAAVTSDASGNFVVGLGLRRLRPALQHDRPRQAMHFRAE
jgi:hypothetical protein